MTTDDAADAVDNLATLEFTYDDLPRVIEPHAVGVTRDGKELLLGFQVDGESSSGTLGWRSFDLAKVRDVRRVGTFAAPRKDFARGDKRFAQIVREL